MAQGIVVLSSITYAYKAQRILEQAWINSSVIRTPEGISDKGCSYSLSVRGDPEQAAGLLQEKGIRVLKTVRRS